MAATQGFFPVQQPFLCLLNVICAVFPSLPVSRAVAQTQTSREQKGTRTPDPLRVMHNDFLIFIALIRQIDEIRYRSATNGNFKRNICHTKFNIVLPILLHCLYKYQLTKRETMYLDTTLICLSSLLLFARSNSCKSVMLEKLLPIIETI